MNAVRRFLLYFAWNKPYEQRRPLEQLDERFPALFELRRVAWPHAEALRSRPQGIGGFLDDVVLSDFEHFRDVIEQAAGVRPRILSAVESDGRRHALSNALDEDFDTCIIVSLDHEDSAQLPNDEDVAAAERFLARPGAVLVICPHHYVGADNDPAHLLAEHRHHGDPLVPGRQRLGGYARALLTRLGLPVANTYGLKPACAPDGQPLPLEVNVPADALQLLSGTHGRPVTTFNAHGHLPHLVPADPSAYRVLARQRIASDAPIHPDMAGIGHFNALLWAPPDARRRGHLLVCDATLWSGAFSGLTSLENLWRNLAAIPVSALDEAQQHADTLRGGAALATPSEQALWNIHPSAIPDSGATPTVTRSLTEPRLGPGSYV